MERERRKFLDRLFGLEDLLSKKGVIEIYGNKDYFGFCTDDKITIHIKGGGIFYYQIAFHEIIHYLERNLWERIKDARNEALEKLKEELYTYRYSRDTLAKAFRKESGRELIELYKSIFGSGEDYQSPPYLRSYPEFFPSLVEMVYLDWHFLKPLLSVKGQRALFGYLNHLIGLGERMLGVDKSVKQSRRQSRVRQSRVSR